MRLDKTKTLLAILPVLVSLLAATLACRLAGAPAGQPTSDLVGTQVAATLTAVAGGVQPTGQPAPTGEPPATQPVEPALLRVVYIKDGNLFLWGGAGAGVPLTTSGQVSQVKLSDDGLVAAYIRQIDDFTAELWAINTDGAGEFPLVTVDDLEAMDPDQRNAQSQALVPYSFEWVPGTHILAFNTRQTYQGPGLDIFDDLRLVDVDTVEIRTLLPAGQGGEFTFSPDGARIAISTPTQINLINVDGGDRRDAVLTYSPVTTYSEYEYYPRPVWAPDSASLRVAIPAAKYLENPAPTLLWEIRVDEPEPTRLGQVPSNFIMGPTLYAPDLAHLLYLAQTGQPEQNLRELHLAAGDGSSDSVVHTANYIEIGSWSPDAQHFVFLVGDQREAQLGRVGGSFAPLAPSPANVAQVRWVDSRRFLYLQGATQNQWELRLGDVDGNSDVLDTVNGLAPSYDFSS